jgi:Ca2+-binding EF-hand superfamily protein
MPLSKMLLPALLSVLTVLCTAGAQAQQQAFMSADKNGDTNLDSAEFKTFVDLIAMSGNAMAGKIKTSGRYSLAFGRIDQNKDGLLAPNELSALK